MQCYAIKCKARQWNDKPRRRKISKDYPILIMNSAQDQIELDPGQVLTNGNIMLLFLPKSCSGDCVSCFGSESRSSSPRRVEGELNVDDEGLFNVQVMARPFQILRRRIRVKVWSSNGQKQLEAGRIPVLIPNIVTGWRGHGNHYCCGVGYWCTWLRYSASYLSGVTYGTARTQEHIIISLFISGSMIGGHASPGSILYRL